MRQRIGLSVLILSLAVLIAPALMQNVYATSGCVDTGNVCYVGIQTNVPTNDATIHVTVDGNPTQYMLPHTFTFANGTGDATPTPHSITVVDTSIKGTSGTRYVFKEWMQCGFAYGPNPSSPTMSVPLMVANYTGPCPFNGPFTADFDVYPPVGCITNCLLDVKTSVTGNDANVVAKIVVTSPCPCTSNYYKLPLASPLAYSNGTTVTIQIMNSTTFTGSSGARYSWIDWTQGLNTNPATMITVQMIANYTTNGAGPFTAQFDKQYQINILFTDSSNQPVNPPSSLTLSSSAGTVTLTSYSNIWLDATVWTTTDATWEGVIGSVTTQTIDLSGAPILTATVQLKAYPQTIHVTDRSNNVVSGVQVTVIFSNSTSKQFTTDNQGNVQLGRLPSGSYTAQLTYQGQNMGRWTADASQTSTNTIQIPVGSSPAQQQVSAIVLLTIFGLAFFLILLAIKVRKPPPPPMIGAAEPSSTGTNR